MATVDKAIIIMGLFILAVAGIATYLSTKPGGEIITKGGSVCAWRVNGDTETERSLMLDCKCPSNGRQYSCQYRSRPDVDCKEKFMKDFFGYFSQIKNKVSASTHGCDNSEVTIPLCGDVKIKRIGEATPTECN